MNVRFIERLKMITELIICVEFYVVSFSTSM